MTQGGLLHQGSPVINAMMSGGCQCSGLRAEYCSSLDIPGSIECPRPDRREPSRRLGAAFADAPLRATDPSRHTCAAAGCRLSGTGPAAVYKE